MPKSIRYLNITKAILAEQENVERALNKLVGDYFAEIIVENEIVKNYHWLSQTNKDDNEQ